MPQTPTKNETYTNKILEKQQLNPQVKLLTIYAPTIAQKAQPGQFVILKAKPNSERIPLTLSLLGQTPRHNHPHISGSRLLNDRTRRTPSWRKNTKPRRTIGEAK